MITRFIRDGQCVAEVETDDALAPPPKEQERKPKATQRRWTMLLRRYWIVDSQDARTVLSKHFFYFMAHFLVFRRARILSRSLDVAALSVIAVTKTDPGLGGAATEAETLFNVIASRGPLSFTRN